MNKRVAISQSNYIPWKGYFDIINSVDEFIIFDDMQFTRRDWRNRNRIKVPTGLKWITIPVEVKGKYYQKINETRISDPSWSYNHWQTITQFYSRAPYFYLYKNLFRDFYLGNCDTSLSKVNQMLISMICSCLNIGTTIRSSSEFNLIPGKTERLLSICTQLGANTYVTGPAAMQYFDLKLAESASIDVEWFDYSDYPEYAQFYPPFEHGVSILDLLFHAGPDAARYMKSF